ncbi:DNA recombination protein RmuC [Methylobacillus flagellatus]|uniref:DNA recombination protein RmuC n=1 Tax=Methylobacillus flagellatus TaxID=405 RepID=UPI0010F639CF|nr:DNA recombination protein RmuC [Methylobacillus flagellatus]
MTETLLLLIVSVNLLTLAWLAWKLLRRNDNDTLLMQQLEQRHLAMLRDLNDGLNKLGDRLNQAVLDSNERLRLSVTQELTQTREAMQALQLSQGQSLAQTRENILEKLHITLAEQGKAEQALIQTTMGNAIQQISQRIEALTKVVEERLEQISGKVSERLDEGFKKTNETFLNVMTHLTKIDEAQKKIDGLATNVVSLQELLGDKRSRGAFGEVQLEGLVRNLLPENAFEFQYTFPNNTRADCVLKLPEPTGLVAVDSKFPLENYEAMFLEGAEKASAAVFKSGVRKHIDDIASKYIIPNVTSDGAVMFLPAEAVFAEIHAHHRDLVEYAQVKRVWIVSPTTLMAVLNTARAVLKDTETRKQVHIIQDELGKLGKDFARFDERMKKLATHIQQASKDVEDVHISSRKITDRFARIERVELESHGITPALPLSDSDND